MTDQPQGSEPMPVQLTRIEGTVNLIAYQMAEVKTEVTRLGTRVTTIELAQAQTTGAASSWRVWLPTILTGLGVLAALGLGLRFGG